MNAIIETENEYGAQNYLPLPVVLTRGEGVYLWDVDGKRYLDMMGAYSAVSFGHCHPQLVTALSEQAKRLAVTSRAFYSDKLAGFLKAACELTEFDKALPMNSGAEAVETALKAARKWGYTQKNIAHDQAEIIVCENNFHGRTIAIVGMSTEHQYREGFGPFPGGFKCIPYGDPQALKEAITPNTAAFLLEPIQGEAGIVMPPEGYLTQCAEICAQNNVLLLCDEIQTGLGRTGKVLAYQHENIKPDGVILGKALGGGLLPVSLFLARADVMDVFTPGDHGSTFGGNPVAAAVGLRALQLLTSEGLAERSAELGEYLLDQLHQFNTPAIKDIRGKGLFIGVEIEPKYATAREICLQLMTHGILSKETHKTVVRLAPPLIITKEQLDTTLAALREVLSQYG